jgi:hypothetical protein
VASRGCGRKRGGRWTELRQPLDRELYTEGRCQVAGRDTVVTDMNLRKTRGDTGRVIPVLSRQQPLCQ